MGDIAGVRWELTSKPVASKAALAESPLGPEVPVHEPADRLVTNVAGHTLLRPDVTGAYVVTAIVTTTGGQTASVSQTFFGATYVGIAKCMSCHGARQR